MIATILWKEYRERCGDVVATSGSLVVPASPQASRVWLRKKEKP